MIYLFIWLHLVLVVAHGIFGIQTLSCSCEPLPVSHDLVPWPGIELGPPALGAWSLSQWTTREVPQWSTKCAITLYLRKKMPVPKSGLTRWLTGIESPCRYRRHGFDPCVREIPWRRKWQLILVFLPGTSHGQRNLASYSPWGCKE